MSKVILFILLITLLSRSAAKLPDYVPKCYRDDPKDEINKCLLLATEKMRPYLKTGVPELGIPPISPLAIHNIRVEQGNLAVNLNGEVRDLVYYGLDSYNFTKFEFDPVRKTFFLDLSLKQMSGEGEYLVQGRILAFPIQGRGKIFVAVTNSSGTMQQSTRLIEKYGSQFLQLGQSEVQFDLGQVSVRLEGLFHGNKVLGEITNNIIQNHIVELVAEFKPAIVKIVKNLVRDILYDTLEKHSYDEIFPLREHTENM